jgi:hypothetical protein
MRVALALIVLASCKVGALVLSGDKHELRPHDDHALADSTDRPPILLVAIDGVSRAMLYDMLRAGELPNLGELLGGDHLAHAHLDDTMLSTLPSTTMAAWVSALTGVPPADHGVVGNEYFIRETRTLACPAPVSFRSSDPTLEIYTDGYLDKLIDAPTVYERLRAKEPNILIWIAMNHVFRGADSLLLPNHDVLGKAMKAFIEVLVQGKQKGARDEFAALDTGAIDTVVEHLASGRTPDVLTVYLYGTDLYAHVAPEGPDRARRAYLREIVDPGIGKLVARLRQRRLLDRTWTIIISDHGHTEVDDDDAHALGGDDGAPVRVLRAAGFRVRPFARDVDPHDPFDAVLAYGGAMAYVYVADRSQCPGAHDVCAWGRPPRYREDVLAAAEAFRAANDAGPVMKGTLDMILVRQPRPFPEIDRPFEVYVGDGATMPIEDYLRTHPHPTYVAFAERMRELAVGVHGERAGDILLIPHDGDRARRDDRYYFALQYHSWHGSASRSDSEIPLIVANRHHRAAEIAAWVHGVIGDAPRLQKLTDVIIGLREGALGQ